MEQEKVDNLRPTAQQEEQPMDRRSTMKLPATHQYSTPEVMMSGSTGSQKELSKPEKLIILPTREEMQRIVV